jgi:hypothetical protein
MDNQEWTIKNGQPRMDNQEWTIKNGQPRMDNREWTIKNGQQTLSICISRKCVILALFLSYVNVNGLLMNDEHLYTVYFSMNTNYLLIF